MPIISFLTYWQTSLAKNVVVFEMKKILLMDSYFDYLTKIIPSSVDVSPNFFPHFEKNYLFSLLEDTSLMTKPFTLSRCIGWTIAIFKAYPHHINADDYQLFFDCWDKNTADGDISWVCYTDRLAKVTLLLKSLLKIGHLDLSRQIKKLKEILLTLLIHYSSFIISEGIDIHFSDYLADFIKIGIEEDHEPNLLSVINNTYNSLSLKNDINLEWLFVSIYWLIEKKNNTFILKLYDLGTSDLKKKIAFLIGLMNPIPQPLQRITSCNNVIISPLIIAVQTQDITKTTMLLKDIHDDYYLYKIVYDLISTSVINSCENNLLGLKAYLKIVDKLLTKKFNSSLYYFSKSLADSLNSLTTNEANKHKILEEKKLVDTINDLNFYDYNNTYVEKIPSLLYLTFINAGKFISQYIDDFLAHIHTINKKNTPSYQIDINMLMLIHIPILLNLYDLMSADLFLFMKKMVKTSILSLDRYLHCLNYIPPTYFPALKKLASCVKSDQIKYSISNYDYLLVAISILGDLRQERTLTDKTSLFSKQQGDDEQMMVQLVDDNSKNPYQLLEFINNTLQVVYRQFLTVPDDAKLDFAIFDNDFTLFIRLLIGRYCLKNRNYLGMPPLSRFFDQCLAHDLRIDSDFNTFAFSPHQSTPLTKHNHFIFSKLREAKINRLLAFNYNHHHYFTYVNTNRIDYEGMASGIVEQLYYLDKLTKNHDYLHLLQVQIKKIMQQINKSGKTNLKPIYNGTLNKFLKTIYQFLLEQYLQKNLTKDIKNHSISFCKYYEILQEKQSDLRQKETNAMTRAFYVAVWDKNKPSTFLLGDYLGCCLAPDGLAFRAIIERRLDAAMMMHVVYDTQLSTPIAGNWLFFAYDSQRPMDIYVVANFFEIRAGYAVDPALRDEIIQQLADYTGAYTEAIGAKGFLIRPLTYGLIPDFDKKYQLESIKIEKVGGFFSTLDDYDGAYYLEALELNEFYRYVFPKKNTMHDGLPFFKSSRIKKTSSGEKNDQKITINV